MSRGQNHFVLNLTCKGIKKYAIIKIFDALIIHNNQISIGKIIKNKIN